jgi:hypothetical protein
VITSYCRDGIHNRWLKDEQIRALIVAPADLAVRGAHHEEFSMTTNALDDGLLGEPIGLDRLPECALSNELPQGTA